jgi:multiple sugar transport system permease protein
VKRLLLLAAVSFCLAPFLWQILTSLRPEAELTTPGLPHTLSLEHYRAIFRAQPFALVLLNSALVAGGTTLLSLSLGAPAAFALAKLEVPGRRVIIAAVLAVTTFPPIATVSPLYLTLRALHLLDTRIGLVLPYATFSLPLAIAVLAAFFRELPDELLHAARIDGCTTMQAFRRVFLPLAAPAIGATAILVFVFAWNELLYALTFLSSPEKRTVPLAIAMLSTEHREPWGEIAAASTIATLPLVVATLLFQRRIVAGLAAGAVKG